MFPNKIWPKIQFQALLSPESTKALWNVREKCFPGIQTTMSNKDQRKVFGLKLDKIPAVKQTLKNVTWKRSPPRLASTGEVTLNVKHQEERARFFLEFQAQGGRNDIKKIKDALITRPLADHDSLRVPLGPWITKAEANERRAEIEEIARREMPLELSISALAVEEGASGKEREEGEEGEEGEEEIGAGEGKWKVYKFKGGEV
jgi:hypothetical protein